MMWVSLEIKIEKKRKRNDRKKKKVRMTDKYEEKKE